MTVTELKIFFLVAILAAAWVGGLLPILRRRAPDDRLMGWGNAFAAGIFLGIGLIHLLGEAHRAWDDLGWHYPMAFVLATAAFAAILLFEHVVLPEPAHHLVHARGGPSDHHHHALPAPSGGPHPYLLVAALSAHSVIAGIALGAQDSFSNLLVLFLAIVAHKSTEGFALGVSLARREIALSRSHGLVALFASTTPAGIVLGMTVSGLLESTGERYFDATLLALAAGTFIYVASLDILQDEFLRPGSRLTKWIFATLGWILVALLAIWL